MSHPAVVIALCALCVFFGILRIGSWVIERREQEQTRILLQQVYAACSIAQVRSEVRRA